MRGFAIYHIGTFHSRGIIHLLLKMMPVLYLLKILKDLHVESESHSVRQAGTCSCFWLRLIRLYSPYRFTFPLPCFQQPSLQYMHGKVTVIVTLIYFYVLPATWSTRGTRIQRMPSYSQGLPHRLVDEEHNFHLQLGVRTLQRSEYYPFHSAFWTSERGCGLKVLS